MNAPGWYFKAGFALILLIGLFTKSASADLPQLPLGHFCKPEQAYALAHPDLWKVAQTRKDFVKSQGFDFGQLSDQVLSEAKAGFCSPFYTQILQECQVAKSAFCSLPLEPAFQKEKLPYCLGKIGQLQLGNPETMPLSPLCSSASREVPENTALELMYMMEKWQMLRYADDLSTQVRVATLEYFLIGRGLATNVFAATSYRRGGGELGGFCRGYENYLTYSWNGPTERNTLEFKLLESSRWDALLSQNLALLEERNRSRIQEQNGHPGVLTEFGASKADDEYQRQMWIGVFSAIAEPGEAQSAASGSGRLAE